MPSSNQVSFSKKDVYLGVMLLVVVAGTLIFGEYRQARLEDKLSVEIEKNQQLSEMFASTSSAFRTTVDNLITKVDMLAGESVALSGVIQNEQNRSAAIQEQIGNVSSTIGTLDKLSKTSPELLKKYSKVYFLNEHYKPASLSSVSPEFAFSKGTTYQVDSKIHSYLENMLRDAKAAGLSLQVISAYRSFGTQAALKSQYRVTYGAGTANTFSADQGYSEHQLGTTLDFTTPIVGATYDNFDMTPEYAWLQNNAYKYGFILSYPKGNKYYVYEPWHWRFVGVDLAARLKRDGLNFYDVDQRTIDNYLSVIFE